MNHARSCFHCGTSVSWHTATRLGSGQTVHGKCYGREALD